MIGACESLSGWTSGCACHDDKCQDEEMRLKGVKRRRALDTKLRSSTGQQARSRLITPTPTSLLNCCMRGRRSPDFACGVFTRFCGEVRFWGNGQLSKGGRRTRTKKVRNDCLTSCGLFDCLTVCFSLFQDRAVESTAFDRTQKIGLYWQLAFMAFLFPPLCLT